MRLKTKSPSPPTVPYRTQSTRSACPSISAEPPSSPAAAESMSPTPREPRLPPVPAGLLTVRVHRATHPSALSRIQPPQKRYRTVNQAIPEVADDSRLRGDNARDAIGPDVRFSRTCASPLEGSPSSKAESTPEALHRARPQPRSPFIEGKSGDGVRASFCNDIRFEHEAKHVIFRLVFCGAEMNQCIYIQTTSGLRIQLRHRSLPSCRNRSAPTDRSRSRVEGCPSAAGGLPHSRRVPNSNGGTGARYGRTVRAAHLTSRKSPSKQPGSLIA